MGSALDRLRVTHGILAAAPLDHAPADSASGATSSTISHTAWRSAVGPEVVGDGRDHPCSVANLNLADSYRRASNRCVSLSPDILTSAEW